jgi:hypothetical protein
MRRGELIVFRAILGGSAIWTRICWCDLSNCMCHTAPLCFKAFTCATFTHRDLDVVKNDMVLFAKDLRRVPEKELHPGIQTFRKKLRAELMDRFPFLRTNKHDVNTEWAAERYGVPAFLDPRHRDLKVNTRAYDFVSVAHCRCVR